MNKTIIVAGMLSFAALLSGAENLMKKPEVSYKVFPGRWYQDLLKSKTLGPTIDPDLDRATNKRKGLLADGKTFQRAVVYNYHRTPQDLCFVTIEIDLGKPRSLSEIRVMAVENNEMYRPAKIEVAGGPDNLNCKALGTSTEWSKKGYVLTAVLKGDWKDCRFLQIKVHCASSWINVSEIEVYDK